MHENKYCRIICIVILFILLTLFSFYKTMKRRVCIKSDILRLNWCQFLIFFLSNLQIQNKKQKRLCIIHPSILYIRKGTAVRRYNTVHLIKTAHKKKSNKKHASTNPQPDFQHANRCKRLRRLGCPQGVVQNIFLRQSIYTAHVPGRSVCKHQIALRILRASLGVRRQRQILCGSS